MMIRNNFLAAALFLFVHLGTSHALMSEEEGMPSRCLDNNYYGLSVHYVGDTFPTKVGAKLELAYNKEGAEYIFQDYRVLQVKEEESVFHLEIKKEALPFFREYVYFFPEQLKVRLYPDNFLDIEYVDTISLYCKQL